MLNVVCVDNFEIDINDNKLSEIISRGDDSCKKKALQHKYLGKPNQQDNRT